jgi:hypothetical protein
VEIDKPKKSEADEDDEKALVGDLSGTTNPQAVVMSAPRAVVANFQPPGTGQALYFYPVTPCRVADTRGNGLSGAFGPPSISGGSARDFPIPNSGIPDGVSFSKTSSLDHLPCRD